MPRKDLAITKAKNLPLRNEALTCSSMRSLQNVLTRFLWLHQPSLHCSLYHLLCPQNSIDRIQALGQNIALALLIPMFYKDRASHWSAIRFAFCISSFHGCVHFIKSWTKPLEICKTPCVFMVVIYIRDCQIPTPIMCTYWKHIHKWVELKIISSINFNAPKMSQNF